MDSTPLTVLIIDDDDGFAMILERRLANALGGSIVIKRGKNLAEGRSLIKELSPDLVVLDQHLPDGRGVDLLTEGILAGKAVLAMSSDDAPDMPAATIRAGAHFFLPKLQVSATFFAPLLSALIERVRLEKSLQEARAHATAMETIRTLISTLQHEINNPLGAILGGAFVLKNSPQTTPDQKEAIRLVEDSGKRIADVIKQLSEAVSLDRVKKGTVDVFHLPNDPKWK